VKAAQAAGGDVFAMQGDLTKVSEVARLFDEAMNHYGHVDIGVNTVGKVLKKPFVETTEEEYDSMFAINSKAAYFFIQEAGKRMNDGGKIITILTSLLAAFTGLYSSYAGSKAPVEHFTRAAAKELGPRGISVDNVAPGPKDTPCTAACATLQAATLPAAQAVRDHATANELDLRVVELDALSQGSPDRTEQGQVEVVVHNAGIGSRVGGALTEKHAGEEQGSSLLR
jgi:NAD(P)-dependent dehydrogenase (short-subunit alcohol dehydrogenase family)